MGAFDHSPSTVHRLEWAESSEIGDVEYMRTAEYVNGEVETRGIKVAIPIRARQEIVKVRRH